MKPKILGGFLVVLFTGLTFYPALAASPSDQPDKIHVTKSEVKTVCESDDKGSSCYLHQFLTATINAKTYELESEQPRGQLLSTGDYQSRIVKDQKMNASEYRREYELIFSDGQTVKYAVVGEFE